MLKADFDQSVAYWLLSTANRLERDLNDELNSHGITYRQFQVLACLAMQGELTQTEIADLLYVEPPTIVRVLDRMERDGWIARHDDPSDRRKKIIRPTNNVEPVWEKFLSCGAIVRQRATRGLDAQATENLISALKIVRANLGSHCSATTRT